MQKVGGCLLLAGFFLYVAVCVHTSEAAAQQKRSAPLFINPGVGTLASSWRYADLIKENDTVTRLPFLELGTNALVSGGISGGDDGSDIQPKTSHPEQLQSCLLQLLKQRPERRDGLPSLGEQSGYSAQNQTLTIKLPLFKPRMRPGNQLGSNKDQPPPQESSDTPKEGAQPPSESGNPDDQEKAMATGDGSGGQEPSAASESDLLAGAEHEAEFLIAHSSFIAEHCSRLDWFWLGLALELPLHDVIDAVPTTPAQPLPDIIMLAQPGLQEQAVRAILELAKRHGVLSFASFFAAFSGISPFHSRCMNMNPEELLKHISSRDLKSIMDDLGSEYNPLASFKVGLKGGFYPVLPPWHDEYVEEMQKIEFLLVLPHRDFAKWKRRADQLEAGFKEKYPGTSLCEEFEFRDYTVKDREVYIDRVKRMIPEMYRDMVRYYWTALSPESGSIRLLEFFESQGGVPAEKKEELLVQIKNKPCFEFKDGTPTGIAIIQFGHYIEGANDFHPEHKPMPDLCRQMKTRFTLNNDFFNNEEALRMREKVAMLQHGYPDDSENRRLTIALALYLQRDRRTLSVNDMAECVPKIYMTMAEDHYLSKWFEQWPRRSRVLNRLFERREPFTR